MVPSSRQRWMAGASLLVIAALSVWLRWPGFSQGGFASHDVAGILHGAMLLHDGALPYVDSIELKAPGTFFLAAVLAGPEGTDIAAFQVWANLWGVATLLLLGGIAWRLWGPAAAVVAAGLYGLHDAHLDSMDANYVTWAQLPLVAAMGAGMVAAQASTRRRELGWWLAAGIAAGLATLLKQPAGVSVVAVMGLALWPGSSDRTTGKERGAVALGGIVAAHLPIALVYGAAGQLTALVDGYIRNTWGMRYVSHGGEPFGLAAVGEGVFATVHFLVLPLCLAALAVVPPRGTTERRTWLALVVWTLGTLAAAWVGLRFYKGYFLAMSAPLCLWAAAPWGALGAASRLRGKWRRLVLLPVLLLALRQMAVLEHQRVDRARPHDQGGRAIAKVVATDQRPGDRIWVWGWHLWDVYPLTGMRSASRVYKSLGLLTPPNDDTWRRPATPLRFVDGDAARIVIEDLRANRPAWIVLGSTVPREQFKALKELLREDYVLERKIKLGRVQFWHRADRAQAQREARAQRGR